MFRVLEVPEQIYLKNLIYECWLSLLISALCSIQVFIYFFIYLCLRTKPLKPINARAGHYHGRHISGHISPAAKARELFKPSKQPESLLVSIKKLESFGFRVFCR